MKRIFYITFFSLFLFSNNTLADNIKPSNIAIDISKNVDKNIYGKYSYETQVIVANGHNLKIDNVVNYNDRTYLPVRQVSEVLKCEVFYDANSKIVTIKSNDTIIEMPQFSNKAVLNGTIVNIDDKNVNVKSILIDDTTYLPLRFIADALGYNIEYNITDKVITLDKLEDIKYQDIDELLPSNIEMNKIESEYHKKVINEHSNYEIVDTGPSKEEQEKIAKQTEDAVRSMFENNKK